MNPPDLDPNAKFFFVCSTGAHGRPFFRRAGLMFEAHKWRPLQLGDRDILDADIPIVSPETFARIEAETIERPVDRRVGDNMPTHGPVMLMMKPGTRDDVLKYVESLSRPTDSLVALTAQNAELASKNAELEARLMRLELAAEQTAAAAKPAPAPGRKG